MTEQQTSMTAKQASRYIGIAESTLRLWRARATGPRFFKAGKLIRYRVVDVNDWIESKLSEPIRDAGAHTQIAAQQ